MDNIDEKECRTIFLDWVINTRPGDDIPTMLHGFMKEYGEAAPEHPMTRVIREGLGRPGQPRGRRGGASWRR